MANMARKDGPGLYQIGIWTVERRGPRKWVAEAECILGRSSLPFPSLDAAHLQLTGEGRRESKSKESAPETQ